jgi:hypothetical protein
MNETCPCEEANPVLQITPPRDGPETLSPAQASKYKFLCPRPPKELEDTNLPFWFFLKELLFPWNAKAAEYDVRKSGNQGHSGHSPIFLYLRLGVSLITPKSIVATAVRANPMLSRG